LPCLRKADAVGRPAASAADPSPRGFTAERGRRRTRRQRKRVQPDKRAVDAVRSHPVSTNRARFQDKQREVNRRKQSRPRSRPLLLCGHVSPPITVPGSTSPVAPSSAGAWQPPGLARPPPGVRRSPRARPSRPELAGARGCEAARGALQSSLSLHRIISSGGGRDFPSRRPRRPRWPAGARAGARARPSGPATAPPRPRRFGCTRRGAAGARCARPRPCACGRGGGRARARPVGAAPLRGMWSPPPRHARRAVLRVANATAGHACARGAAAAARPTARPCVRGHRRGAAAGPPRGARPPSLEGFPSPPAPPHLLSIPRGCRCRRRHRRRPRLPTPSACAAGRRRWSAPPSPPHPHPPLAIPRGSRCRRRRRRRPRLPTSFARVGRRRCGGRTTAAACRRWVLLRLLGGLGRTPRPLVVRVAAAGRRALLSARPPAWPLVVSGSHSRCTGHLPPFVLPSRAAAPSSPPLPALPTGVVCLVVIGWALPAPCGEGAAAPATPPREVRRRVQHRRRCLQRHPRLVDGGWSSGHGRRVRARRQRQDGGKDAGTSAYGVAGAGPASTRERERAALSLDAPARRGMAAGSAPGVVRRAGCALDRADTIGWTPSATCRGTGDGDGERR